MMARHGYQEVAAAKYQMLTSEALDGSLPGRRCQTPPSADSSHSQVRAGRESVVAVALAHFLAHIRGCGRVGALPTGWERGDAPLYGPEPS
jgi:hypothetical protein